MDASNDDRGFSKLKGIQETGEGDLFYLQKGYVESRVKVLFFEVGKCGVEDEVRRNVFVENKT